MEHDGRSFKRLELGWQSFYLVAEAYVLKPVLNFDTDSIDKGKTAAKLEPLLGRSTLSMCTKHSMVRRAMVQGRFCSRSLRQYSETIAARVTEAVAECAQYESPFRLYPWTSALALRLVSDALFGRGSITRRDEDNIIAALREIEDGLGRSMWRVMPRLPWKAAAEDRVFSTSIARLDEVVEHVRSKARPGSIIDEFISKGLDSKAVRDEIITYLMAGHHTTGAVAAYLLYHLAARPDIAELIAGEVNENSCASGQVPFEAWRKMPVTQGAVLETLRMYPAGWWFVREVEADCRIGEQIFHRGDSILVSPWFFHRNPKHWRNPGHWNPLRNKDLYRTSNGFIPYGTGTRACVSANLATLELQVIAGLFCASLSMKDAAHGADISPRPLVTLHPPETLAVSFSVRELSNGKSQAMEVYHDSLNHQQSRYANYLT